MMCLLPLPVLSWRPVVALHAALWLVACGGVGDAAVTTPPTTTPVTSATFTLTSSATAADGSLSTTYTCDGTSTSPPLSWRGLPTGTVSLAMLMTTIPTQGATKYNWLLYNLPVTDSSIAAGTNGQGTVGFADDGGGLSYASPCSQGPGLKTYTFTLYALSQRPTLMGLAANQVTGAALTAAADAGVVDHHRRAVRHHHVERHRNRRGQAINHLAQRIPAQQQIAVHMTGKHKAEIEKKKTY
mgnify:CR=1 FL=1